MKRWTKYGNSCRMERRLRSAPRQGCWEIWWTWSGSNRRPLPCHFSSSIVAERHGKSVSDTEGQCSCGVARYSLPRTCTGATASDRTRDGQGSRGYDTSHDTKFCDDFPNCPLDCLGANRGGVASCTCPPAFRKKF